MRKIRVNLIWVLVILALVALLIIEAFQTVQLVDRKTKEFQTNIGTSLERIASRHEKAEDIRRYLQIVNRDFSGQYKDVLKEEFKNLLASQESISIRDTSVYENGEFQNYLIIKGKSFDTISGLSTEQRVLARDVRQLRELFDKKKQSIPHNDSARLAIQLDQRVMQQIFKKAKFVNDMMVEAFRNNVYEDPSKRVDIAFLDSVIRTELANDALPKNYEFMLANEYGIPIPFKNSPKTYRTELDTLKTSKTLLFPSNVLDEDIFLHIDFPKKDLFILKIMSGPLFVNLTLLFLIIVTLGIMFKTILAQQKISEIKNDFISNMTHEFKTPIATISLACQALGDQDVLKSTADIRPFVKMIDEENKRLSVLVESILQSSVMEKGTLRLNIEQFEIKGQLKNVFDHARFRIEQAGGRIQVEMPDELVYIEADRLHFTNVISNLLDNSIKYSSDSPFIEVLIKNDPQKVSISVKDFGIGIKKEHINKIFDKLYRIPTGNVHNVKGFGLGLSYVKAIVDLHGWSINVRSKHGEGTVFTLIINKRK